MNIQAIEESEARFEAYVQAADKRFWPQRPRGAATGLLQGPACGDRPQERRAHGCGDSAGEDIAAASVACCILWAIRRGPMLPFWVKSWS